MRSELEQPSRHQEARTKAVGEEEREPEGSSAPQKSGPVLNKFSLKLCLISTVFSSLRLVEKHL